MFRYALLAPALLATLPATAARAQVYEVTVRAGAIDRLASPVRVPLPAEAAGKVGSAAVLKAIDGRTYPAQVTAPGLLAPKAEDGRPELHFLLPMLAAGQSAGYTIDLGPDASTRTPAATAFRWTEGPDADSLAFGDRPVLRYEHPRLDTSSKEAREATFKPYHHVFDPASGGTRLTKGPGGLYTHHRGLFFGFNKVSYDGGKATCDVWHCTGDAFQSHESTLSREAGPVLGRHVVEIAWHGPKGQVFAVENRELTAFATPGGTLLQFASRVESKVGPVRLDGDPQHAGFHFRADQEVAESTKGETYYLRPDGPGKKGETRNWEPKTKQGPTDLPWNAMSFVRDGKRYTAVYLDRPANPKEARFSERDYGRFGSYFEYDLDAGRPLEVSYRVWIQEGELTVARASALDADLVSPPEVTIKLAN